METKPTILIDFDGVIYSYTSGYHWNELPDEPNEGAIEWLNNLLKENKFMVYIFSTRCVGFEGVKLIVEWLVKNELESVAELHFIDKKIAAHIMIDDRCFCFKGEFPDMDYLLSFKSYPEMRKADNNE